jgi:hypothetical protein
MPQVTRPTATAINARINVASDPGAGKSMLI